MNLEELIYELLSNHVYLSNKLARYQCKPAIFYQDAPPDTDPGWKKQHQYPRLSFTVDMQADSERKSAGVMQISIWCSETGTMPEELEPILKSALKDIFIQPSGREPFCLTWSKSETYTLPNSVISINMGVIGIDMFFDILEFPCQETCDPDPILALKRYTKDVIQSAIIIGSDKINKFFMAGERSPAFYFRITKFGTEKESFTVSWVNTNIAIHIFSPKPEQRLKWIRLLSDQLAIDSEVLMLDKSPMLIKEIQVNMESDYLTTGQIQLKTTFGILRKRNMFGTIKNVHM